MADKAQIIDFLLAGYRTPTTDVPLSAGKVYTYLAGTTTNATTWTDRDKTTPAANPVVLDSTGKAEIYGDNVYNFVIKDSSDNTIETIEYAEYKNRYGEAVNIIDYGAVAGQDCTSAIQAAGNYAITNKKRLYFPGSAQEYLCGSVTFAGEIHAFGDGMGVTVIRPTQATGQVCWTLSSAAHKSSISGMSFSRTNGTQDIGTALKTHCYGVQLDNIDFIHNQYGVHGAENYFYHKYTNVYHHNNSSFLVDSTSNNDNTFIACEFQNQVDISGGNSINFYGCDFSSNTTIGNLPFQFIDPVSVHFFGLYVETVDSGGTGPFDLFNFEKTGSANCCVHIFNIWAKGTGGDYDSVFVFDGVKGSISGGYVFDITNVAETANGGSVTFYTVGKKSGTNYFPASSSGSIYDHNTMRFGTRVSTPIASGEQGVAVSTAAAEINASGATTTTPAYRSSKAATSGLTRHYEVYSGTSLAGHLGVNNNTSVWVSPATGGGVSLLSGNSTRVDKVDGAFRPSDDNAQTLGASGNRWSVVYAGTGTINTSDAREKQDISELNDAELAVAAKLRGIIKKFRFKDSVATKKDGARIHVGVIAQEIIDIFASEGLNAYRYGLLCYDEWLSDDDTQAGNRFGIRYDELLAFIIAAI